jgi:phosphatidate cytidylyltransferase
VNELAKRVLVSIVLAAIVITIIWVGGAAFVTLLSLASGLAAWEFYRIAQGTGARPFVEFGVALSALVPMMVHARFLGFWVPPVSIVALLVPLLLALALFRRGTLGSMGAVGATLIGVLYTGGLLSFAYGLRYHDFVIDAKGGTAMVLLPLMVTWCNDTGAYFVGRAFGRAKLMPSVSPGKTWAGAYGGAAAGLLATWMIAAYVLPPLAHVTLRPLAVVVIGLALSAVSQIGDLVESMLKREAGVKDSSHLIPGHGGVLDRIDALIFVLPVAYVLLSVFLTYRP